MTVCDVCKKPSAAAARVVQYEIYSDSEFSLTSQLCPTCRVAARAAMKAATVAALTTLIKAGGPPATTVPAAPAAAPAAGS